MVVLDQGRAGSAAGPRWLSLCLMAGALNLLGCHQLNPVFHGGNDDKDTSSSEVQDQEESKGNAASQTSGLGSAEAELSNDGSGPTEAAMSSGIAEVDEDSTMSTGPTSLESPSSDASESSTEKPWSYCDVPASLCLNMNDPSRLDVKADALTFGADENASYVVSDKPKWPEVSWLDLKGRQAVRSNTSVMITTVTGADDDQLGMDAWIRHDPNFQPEIMVSIEGMMALGRGDDGRIRCSGFWDPQLSFAPKWRSTSFFSEGAGDWQHVACYAKGTSLGIWFLGKATEQKDHFSQNDQVPINPRSEARIILGKSDWIEYKAGAVFDTSSADIAGIRLWNNVDAMIRVLNEEHAAQADL